MTGPTWLGIDTSGTAPKLVSTKALSAADNETYPVSILVIDDDGKTGTYSFDLKINISAGG